MSSEFEELEWRRRSSKKCEHAHYCGDWDGMFITPLTDEYECCSCMCDGVMPDNYAELELHASEREALEEWLKSLS